MEVELAAAAADRDQALAAQAATNYPQAILSAHSARSNLEQAYFLSLKPVTPEFRAFWEADAHSAPKRPRYYRVRTLF